MFLRLEMLVLPGGSGKVHVKKEGSGEVGVPGQSENTQAEWSVKSGWSVWFFFVVLVLASPKPWIPRIAPPPKP